MNESRPQFAQMTMFEIEKVVQENEFNKTFYLKNFIGCKAGQFVMVWLPGVDEKPFSVMNYSGKSAINLEVKGKWSKEFFSLKAGERIGIRGPFGKPFDLSGVKKACIVGGGVGVVPLIPLLFELKKIGAKTTFILGARSKERVLFRKIIEKNSLKLHIATDDGSVGQRGFVTDILGPLLKKQKFDCVFSCGPEQMMLNVFKLCKNKKVKVQASLERYMKCGFGVCGACMIDGKIVCIDGPVFDSKELSKLAEFGQSAYIKSGKKCSLKDFYSRRTP